MTTSWARIALLYAIGVLAAAQMGVVPPLVPSLQHDLGLSLAEAGMAVSIITLMGALFGLPAGRWCDTAGHARALGIGLLIMAAASMLCAAAQDAMTLLAARALAGVGYLLVVVAAPSLMAGVAQPRHHAYALSLWGTFVPAGIALGGVVGASFAAAGWRTLVVIDGAALAVAAVAAFLAVPATAARPPEERPASLEPLAKALPLSFAFFCFALLFLALAGLLPTYLIESRDLATTDAGRLAGIAAGFGIAGSLAAAGILRRGVAPARLIAVGLLSSTALADLSFVGALPVPLAVIGFTLAYALGGVVPAATFASVPTLAGGLGGVGLINGLLAQTGSLGSLAGPPALALWTDWIGWSMAPVLLILVAAAGATAALAVRPASPPP